MKYLVYPPGYDPLAPAQEESMGRKQFDRKWDREAIQRQQFLASLAKVVDEEPLDGRWYHPIEDA